MLFGDKMKTNVAVNIGSLALIEKVDEEVNYIFFSQNLERKLAMRRSQVKRYVLSLLHYSLKFFTTTDTSLVLFSPP